MDFLKINFGYMSAEKESTSAPQLLLEGYLDHGNLAHEALYGERFLFLGYKGSGKSAIAERGRLLAHGNPELFVTVAHLHDFPYETLRSEVLPGGASRHPAQGGRRRPSREPHRRLRRMPWPARS